MELYCHLKQNTRYAQQLSQNNLIQVDSPDCFVHLSQLYVQQLFVSFFPFSPFLFYFFPLHSLLSSTLNGTAWTPDRHTCLLLFSQLKAVVFNNSLRLFFGFLLPFWLCALVVLLSFKLSSRSFFFLVIGVCKFFFFLFFFAVKVFYFFVESLRDGVS